MMIAHTADGVWIQRPGLDRPYHHPPIPPRIRLLEALEMMAIALKLSPRKIGLDA